MSTGFPTASQRNQCYSCAAIWYMQVAVHNLRALISSSSPNRRQGGRRLNIRIGPLQSSSTSGSKKKQFLVPDLHTFPFEYPKIREDATNGSLIVSYPQNTEDDELFPQLKKPKQARTSPKKASRNGPVQTEHPTLQKLPMLTSNRL